MPKTPAGKGRSYVSLYLPTDLHKRLGRVAKAKDVSVNKLCYQLLADGLEHEEMMVTAMTDPVVMPAIMKALSEPSVLASMLRAMKHEVSADQLELFEQQIVAATAVTPALQAKRKARKQ
jgi:hypothetical protein